MKINVIVIILAILIFAGNVVAGLPTVPPDSLSTQIFKAIILGDYQKAESINDSMMNLPQTFWNKEDWYKYHQLQIMIGQRQDYGIDYNKEKYEALYIEVESAFTNTLKKAETGADSAAAYFVLGGLRSFDASLLDMQGKMLSARNTGKKSIKLMEKALSYYPDLIDARFLDAVLDYYESKYLGWTPFKKDNREESIGIIEVIAEKGVYSKYVAISTLTWIYIEEDELTLATKWSNYWLEELGDIRQLLEPCGKAYFLAEDWENAADRYERFLASLQSMPVRNLKRELGAYNRLVTIYYADERWEKVINRAENALDLPLDETILEEKKSVISNIKKLRKKSSKKLAKR